MSVLKAQLFQCGEVRCDSQSIEFDIQSSVWNASRTGKKDLSDIFEWTVAMLMSLSPWYECLIKYSFGNYLVGIKHKPEFAKDLLLKEPKESNYLENQRLKFSFIVCVKPSHPTGIVTVICILILPKGIMQSCQFNSLRLVFGMLPNQLRIKNPHWVRKLVLAL